MLHQLPPAPASCFTPRSSTNPMVTVPGHPLEVEDA